MDFRPLHVSGYLRHLYPARDVQVFLVAVTIWFKEPNQEDSWYHYHAYQWIHFVYFACKTNGKILFYKIIFFKKLLYYIKYLTNSSFLLYATVFDLDPRPMELFVETHAWNEGCRKGVQQLVNSQAHKFMVSWISIKIIKLFFLFANSFFSGNI